MKQCVQCGQFSEDSAAFCTACGAPLSQRDHRPRAATKKEFLALPENGKLKKEIRSNAIICYVCAGISLVLALFVLKSPYMLIDVAILLGLGLGIHLAQSRVCAVMLCVYAVINTGIGFLENGKFSGYLVLLAGIYSVISTFKIEKQWKEYQNGNG